MHAVNKGFTITGVTGVSRIEIDERGDWVETTIIGEDWKLSFDPEGLIDFSKAVQRAVALVEEVNNTAGR